MDASAVVRSSTQLEHRQAQDAHCSDLAVDASFVSQAIVRPRLAEQLVEEISVFIGHVRAQVSGEGVCAVPGLVLLRCEPDRELSE